MSNVAKFDFRVHSCEKYPLKPIHTEHLTERASRTCVDLDRFSIGRKYARKRCFGNMSRKPITGRAGQAGVMPTVAGMWSSHCLLVARMCSFSEGKGSNKNYLEESANFCMRWKVEEIGLQRLSNSTTCLLTEAATWFCTERFFWEDSGCEAKE